jgi:D-glycero-D-manno-heptose 1,7-bisphosphate phosphatase
MGKRSVSLASPVRAVFLDRDGVLNSAVVRDGKPYPPACVEDVEIVPQAPGALRRLKSAGFVLIVVTNQPDIARGTTTLLAVEAINQRLVDAMPLDAIEVCPHDDRDNCDCRKPKAGMLTRSGARFQVDMSASYMIGDRWRDINAGRAAGCRTILVGDGWGEAFQAPPDAMVESIKGAVDWILGHTR